MTGPSMAKTAKEAGAFLKALQSEIDGIRNDLKKDLARQVYGSGFGNGTVAQCGVTSAANVVVLSSAEAIIKGHLYIGMLVDIGTIASPSSLVSGEAITAINQATPSITVTTAITTTTANYVSRKGGATNEITGLTEIVSTTPTTGTIGTLNAATAGNEYWRNKAAVAAGSALSITNMATAFNEVRIAGGDVSLMTGSFGIERQIFQLLQSQVRYTEPTKLAGGYKALDWQGKPFVADVDHPFGRVNFVDERFLKVFNTMDWHFLDEEGNVLKWVTGYDAWEAVLARYLNLGATRRNVHYVLSGVTDTTGT